MRRGCSSSSQRLPKVYAGQWAPCSRSSCFPPCAQRSLQQHQEHSSSCGLQAFAHIQVQPVRNQSRRVLALGATATPAAATSPPTTSQALYQQLLSWSNGSMPETCHVQDMGLGRGRGLVASADLGPGQTILRVPLTKVFSSASEEQLELHWSADLALRLLREVAACKHMPSSNGNTSAQPISAGAGPATGEGPAAGGSADAGHWCPWVATLPLGGDVLTPLEFGPRELSALGDESVAAEVGAMQECMGACYEVLEEELSELGAGWPEFLDAVQVLHSRCFYNAETRAHLAVPGVDMANHDSVAPSAQVGIEHSPGAVQGLDALDEVCDVSSLPPAEPSCFVLKAGPAGIKAGQEITISYGPWPDQAFLLLFGFLPQPNPYNSVCLFPSLGDLCASYGQQLLQQAHSQGTLQGLQWSAGLQDAVRRAASNCPEQHDFDRLSVLADGWDGRVGPALSAAHGVAATVLAAASGASVALPQVPAAKVLRAAASCRLDQLQQAAAAAGLASKEGPAAGAGGARADAALALAQAWRQRQEQVLQAFLTNAPSA